METDRKKVCDQQSDVERQIADMISEGGPPPNMDDARLTTPLKSTSFPSDEARADWERHMQGRSSD